MILHDTPQNITQQLIEMFPDAKAALETSQSIKPGLLGYQAMALFGLAKQFNRAGAAMLELGTAVGYSASMMAQGAPLARITTLNPREGEIDWARRNLSRWPQVQVVVRYSWDYLAEMPEGARFDMIFVDGDHNRIARDLPWFNHLETGGLFLCHDYTPTGAKKPSPIVYDELTKFRGRLGRGFDVSVIDSGNTGMVGFYRRDGEMA